MEKTIRLGLSNYYGSVVAYRDEFGLCYMSLGNYDGDDVIKISEELFEAIEREFDK